MTTHSHASICLLAMTIYLTGCGNDANITELDPAPPAAHGAHASAHPEEGPHHGHLIELGSGEYHAELLHDDQLVTIYILDGTAKVQVPISATEIMLNTSLEGKPQQFALSATAAESDPSGTSSRFISEDPALVAHLQREDLEARLALTIQGKSYRGSIDHHGAEHEH